MLYKLLSVFCILLSPIINATESTSKTTAPAAPQASVTPKWSISYANYHYLFEGNSTANTNIYRFGQVQVDMHLFTGVWTPNPQWTFMAFVPYLRNSVETIYEPVTNGLNYKTLDQTEGLADIRLMAMSPFYADTKQLLLYDLGMTAPTGRTDLTFNSAPYQGASYNMQLGSGTPDLIAGLSYLHFTTKQWNQSARLQYTERLGKNSHGWALGDEIQSSLSSRFQFNSWLNTGLQFNYKNRAKVQGRDKRYELMNNYSSLVAQGDGHQYYHGSQINYDLSALVKAEIKTKAQQTMALELALPVWQDAINKDDIRLDTQYSLTASVGAAF